MQAQETLLPELTAIGFAKNEARAYLCLLRNGALTAPQISRAVNIPKSKIYEILESLQDRGIVEGFPGSPRRFRAGRLDSFLEETLDVNRARLAEMEKTTARLKSSLDEIEKVSRVGLPHKGQVDNTEILWTVNGKRGFHEKFVELGAAAKEEILVMSPTFSRNPLLEEGIIDASRRGVSIRGITALSPENAPRIKFWLRHYNEMRHFSGGIPLTVLIFDNARAIYRLSYESEGKSNHIGVFSSSPDFVAAMRQYWDALWATSRKIMPKRLVSSGKA